MKILYISGGSYPDYQCDLLFHGLRSLIGPDVVDVNRIWYLYKSAEKDKPNLYGKGFTYSALLDESPIDRSHEYIKQRIKTKDFDCVIFGSVWRCLTYLPLVQSVYPKKKIVFIDGEDHKGILGHLKNAGHYFKRECTVDYVHPIQFAIPKEKIVASVPAKDLRLAPLIPGVPATYIYNDEEHYRRDYQRSWFGMTMKKAGWDCLRHYEIIANGAIPLFSDIEQCPRQTMTWFPKSLCLTARDAFHNHQLDDSAKGALAEAFLDRASELTTEHLARYVLDKIK